MRPLLCLALVALAGVTARAAVPPPDKLLPADTLAVFTVTDYAKAKADAERWAALKFWNDPAMKPFREKFQAKLKTDLLEPLEREFGIKFADYKDLCQGQITLALMPGGRSEKGQPETGFLLLVDAKDKSEVLKTNLASLKRKWIESGKTARPEKIRDVEFSMLVFSSDDFKKTMDKAFPPPKKEKDVAAGEEKQAPKKQEWLVGQSGSLLIVGTSAKDIEKVLIRQSGGSVPSLAEHGPFVANYGSLFRDTLSYGWLDLKSVIEFSFPQMPTQGGEEEEAAGLDPSKLLSVLGLGGLQSLAMSWKDSSEGGLGTVTVTAPESARRGIARILAHEARDASPPPFIPHDVVKFTRWRIDLPKAWTGLETMLTDLSPAYANVIKLIIGNAGKDQDPNFDLRKSLIANLGDDLIIFEKKPKQMTMEAIDRPPTLYLLGSARPEQLAAAVKSLTAFLPQPSKFKEREFLGRKVYTVTLPATAPREGARLRRPQERLLSYAASGSYVAFANDAALLEEYLRAAEARPLRELPGLAQAAEKVGGMSTGLFTMENQQETMRATFEMLKKDAGAIDEVLGSGFVGKLGTGQDQRLKGWFDFSLLPNFDSVAKYFHIKVSAASVKSDGIHFKWFTPTPPGLK